MKTCRFFALSALTTLAACGGAGPETDDRASATTSVVEWPLLDDEGRFMPSLPGATPADLPPHAGALRFASAAQAQALEAALGARAVRLDIDRAGGMANALALGLAASERASEYANEGANEGANERASERANTRAADKADLPDGLPVLVHGRDLQQAVTLAGQLTAAGLKGVWVVRS